jgi:hypothetical protein
MHVILLDPTLLKIFEVVQCNPIDGSCVTCIVYLLHLTIYSRLETTRGLTASIRFCHKSVCTAEFELDDK